MVAPPGGTTASAKLWLLAFPGGIPASSRIDEPSAVMKASRCSRRTMSIKRRLVLVEASGEPALVTEGAGRRRSESQDGESVGRSKPAPAAAARGLLVPSRLPRHVSDRLLDVLVLELVLTGTLAQIALVSSTTSASTETHPEFHGLSLRHGHGSHDVSENC